MKIEVINMEKKLKPHEIVLHKFEVEITQEDVDNFKKMNEADDVDFSNVPDEKIAKEIAFDLDDAIDDILSDMGVHNECKGQLDTDKIFDNLNEEYKIVKE